MIDFGSLHGLIERLKVVAPEVIALATAATDEEFCECFDRLMERAVDHLEKNAANFADLDEVGLTAALAAFFNGMPGLSIIQEGHSNGHVDLTILVRLAYPVQRRLAEAKIDRGPAYHVGALQQLLNRYSTGRDKFGFVIEYVRLPAIKSRITALRSHLDAKLPCGQIGQCLDHALKWTFQSEHAHSSGEKILITHVGCNLHVP